MVEEWRQVPIEQFRELYEISSLGRLRRIDATGSRAAGHIHKPKVTAWGYLTYKLTADGRRKFYLAHVLVALAFIGPRPSPKHCVAHFDGNQTNNAVNNLRWATYAENNGPDKRRHGRAALGNRNGSRLYPERLKRGDENGSRLYPERLRRGSKQHLAKLTEPIVADIRRRYARGTVTQLRLSEEYGVSQVAISCVIKRKTWAHVP